MVAATFNVSMSSGATALDVARQDHDIGHRAGLEHALAVLGELGEGAVDGEAGDGIDQALPLVRSAVERGSARHGRLDAEQRVERRDRPVARKHQPRAGVADRLPGIAGHHALAADHGEDRLDRIGAARRVRRLHRRQHAEFGEARQVGRRQHFDVLDPVAAVAAPVGAPGGCIAVQRAVDRGVADRVHRDLQAEPVGLDADGVEFILLEEGEAADAGRAVVVLEHVGGGRFDDAVHEHLHEIRFQPVGMPAAAHLHRLAEFGQRHAGQHAERHAAAHAKPLGLVDLLQQLQLVKIAVHVVEAGDAERCAIGEAAPHDVLVDFALRGGRRCLRLVAHEAEHLAPAGRREAGDRREPLELAQFPGRKTIVAHHDFAARRRGEPVQDARRLQRRGVRPHRVVIAGEQRQRSVGQDAVEHMAGDRLRFAEHEIGGLLDDQHPRVGFLRRAFAHGCRDPVEACDAGKRQALQLRAAGKQMDVAVDEAGQDRGAACIDSPCGG